MRGIVKIPRNRRVSPCLFDILDVGLVIVAGCPANARVLIALVADRWHLRRKVDRTRWGRCGRAPRDRILIQHLQTGHGIRVNEQQAPGRMQFRSLGQACSCCQEYGHCKAQTDLELHSSSFVVCASRHCHDPWSASFMPGNDGRRCVTYETGLAKCVTFR